MATAAQPAPGPAFQQRHMAARCLLVLLLNALATVHVVWFYLARVACYVDLAAYEQGRAPNPAQSRVLMMAPLRWAHGSPWVLHLAGWLNLQRGWFPRGVRPEGLVEALIDTLAVAASGLVARAIYRRASRTGLLTAYVYPLTLLMVVSTYALLTFHTLRFTSDLPGMAFFSFALYLIYIRAHPGWFALVFVAATLNRETTLVLLLFFALGERAWGQGSGRRSWMTGRMFGVVAPLAMAWAGWHLWIAHHFARNPSMAGPRLSLNLEILMIPVAWPQLLCAFAYMLPLVLLHQSSIRDRVLRAWLWALPAWALVMFYYGLVVEVRIFGELIPYVACLAALAAEEQMLAAFRARMVTQAAGYRLPCKT